MGALQTVTLTGGSRARGEQHGELLGEQVRQSGIIDFYRHYCERVFFPDASAAVKSLVSLLHALCARRFSPETRELIRGFCRGGGFPEEIIARGVVMPDILNFLVGFRGALARAVPALGCTSAAAWGDYTKDGRFRFGRNLDFPGNGVWDQFPTVFRQRPDRGIPYVSIGTAGSILDGITGLNAEGLSVALHQHIASDVAILTDGRPILDLGLRVLQFARTTQEAVGLCSSWKPTSAWSVVLTHWKERRAAIVELTPRGVRVRRFDGGKMVRANSYHDPELQGRELDYPPFRESSRLRAERADRLLEENRGRIDARTLASLLADHLDPGRGRIRAFGQAIAQPHNMTSVVFEPEEGIAWVAEGDAPANGGGYRRVALWEDTPPGAELEGVDRPLSARQKEGYRTYMGATISWRGRARARALAQVGEAVQLDPGEPIYRYMHGLLALKLGEPRAAVESLEAGAAMPDYPHRAQAQRLWQARALDLLERRREAVALYRGLADDKQVKSPVRRAAARGLSQPYPPDALDKVIPDFFYGDTPRY